MPQPAWTTRAYEPGDDAGILALRRATFGAVDEARLLPAVWRWQFVDNPAGSGYIRLADHDGTIVGQYAAIPTRFRLGADGGSEHIFAMSCDTMTHPAFQRQGMFVRLAQELYDDITSRLGVTTVWGFPNPASYPGFVGRLGWFDIHEFPTYVKPLQSARMLARYVGSRALAAAVGGAADRLFRLATPRVRAPRRCTVTAVSAFDGRFADLWHRHQALAEVIQVRDPAYLHWRYCAAPIFAYRPFAVTVGGALEGYVVLRLLTLFDMPFCAVVDLFPCPVVDAEITREVLAFAQLNAAASGAAFLTALLPPKHAHHLTRFGFLKVPRVMNPRPWRFGARCQPADQPVLRNVDNWYVTYGESDIV
jgi:hypothetical protein